MLNAGSVDPEVGRILKGRMRQQDRMDCRSTYVATAPGRPRLGRAGAGKGHGDVVD